MSVKNVITLGKVRSVVVLSVLFLLLFVCFKLQPLSNVHTKNTRNKLAHLVMGTIFLVLQHVIQFGKGFLKDKTKPVAMCIILVNVH